jgi:hypothetical protein
MRKLWCPTCSEWVEYDRRQEEPGEVRARHKKWCRLDPDLVYSHTDLVILDQYLNALYVLPQ